jgi:hypothetical protein
MEKDGLIEGIIECRKRVYRELKGQRKAEKYFRKHRQDYLMSLG